MYVSISTLNNKWIELRKLRRPYTPLSFSMVIVESCT